MTVINTNVGALPPGLISIKLMTAMQKSMERLSSGLRINSAADDAAGLAVANKMESQLRGMNVAIRNSQDGISLVQTAEAGMGEISNMVIRMRELAVQMNNGVYTSLTVLTHSWKYQPFSPRLIKLLTTQLSTMLKCLMDHIQLTSAQVTHNGGYHCYD